MMRILLLLVALAVCGSQPGLAANPIFDELTSNGVVADKGPAVVLPAPTMRDGLSAAEQQAALETLATERRPVDALLRKAVTAPVVFVSTDDDASAKAGGHMKRVDFWFVVYGDLKKIIDEGFWEADKSSAEQAQPNPNDARLEGKLLKPEELKARGIQPLIAADTSEHYGSFDVQLFNRVRVQGVTRSVQTQTDESVTYAAVLDPRFVGDKEYPNQWQSVSRDDAGKLKFGPLEPYAGMGTYAKATALKQPAGAILVEYHMAYAEPEGWFRGANVIRTKLPVIVQDNVKKLRRKLDEKK